MAHAELAMRVHEAGKADVGLEMAVSVDLAGLIVQAVRLLDAGAWSHGKVEHLYAGLRQRVALVSRFTGVRRVAVEASPVTDGG
jgi:hypothetical protein